MMYIKYHVYTYHIQNMYVIIHIQCLYYFELTVNKGNKKIKN
jgi:hypothetical protein